MHQGCRSQRGIPLPARRQLAVSCAEPVPAPRLSIRVTSFERDKLRTLGLHNLLCCGWRFALSRDLNLHRCRGCANHKRATERRRGSPVHLCAVHLRSTETCRRFAQTHAAVRGSTPAPVPWSDIPKTMLILFFAPESGQITEVRTICVGTCQALGQPEIPRV